MEPELQEKLKGFPRHLQQNKLNGNVFVKILDICIIV